MALWTDLEFLGLRAQGFWVQGCSVLGLGFRGCQELGAWEEGGKSRARISCESQTDAYSPE